MPVANFDQYCKMLDNAKNNKFAYPAINVTSMATANAALQAFANQKCDGIIQVSTGGGQFASGLGVQDAVLGAISIAQHIHLVAEKYNILVALHTDHCVPAKVDSFLKPLIAETEKRRDKGEKNLFNSHMFDGSELPLEENMKIAKELGELCSKNEIILEIEAGVVGGEEDGIDNSDKPADKLYTTPEDMLTVAKDMGSISGLRFIFAATFGNVHGSYKPGHVKLKPSILKDGQDLVTEKGFPSLDLVFHGGSGTPLHEIRETLDYGVIKMNVDTDTQYAFTRPIVDHMFTNYSEVIKMEGEVGNKKKYDPRSYLKAGEKGMTQRIEEACEALRAPNTSILA